MVLNPVANHAEYASSVPRRGCPSAGGLPRRTGGPGRTALVIGLGLASITRLAAYREVGSNELKRLLLSEDTVSFDRELLPVQAVRIGSRPPGGWVTWRGGTAPNFWRRALTGWCSRASGAGAVDKGMRSEHSISREMVSVLCSAERLRSASACQVDRSIQGANDLAGVAAWL